LRETTRVSADPINGERTGYLVLRIAEAIKRHLLGHHLPLSGAEVPSQLSHRVRGIFHRVVQYRRAQQLVSAIPRLARIVATATGW